MPNPFRMTLTCVIEPSQVTPLLTQVVNLITPLEIQDLLITRLHVGAEILAEFRRHPDTFDRVSYPFGYVGVMWGAQVWSDPTMEPYEIHIVADDLLPEAGDRERRGAVVRPAPAPLPPVTTTVWDRL